MISIKYKQPLLRYTIDNIYTDNMYTDKRRQQTDYSALKAIELVPYIKSNAKFI